MKIYNVFYYIHSLYEVKMISFILNVVVCDYKNQKMKFQVLHLQTKDNALDKYLVKLKQPTIGNRNNYPRILTDSKQIELAFKEYKKIYKLYFQRDDITVSRHKTKEYFYDYVFSKLYMEVHEDNLLEYSDLIFDDNYFQKSNVASQFTIDLNIHIKDSIQSKLQYLE